jgi:hypothetical protein
MENIRKDPTICKDGKNRSRQRKGTNNKKGENMQDLLIPTPKTSDGIRQPI